MNILIADDNKQITEVLAQYAKKENFTPYIAEDGEKALALFEQYPFEMVLLDVMMPKKDGFEVCREIRKQSGVPIIMITARGEDFERIMGLDIGADDYIVKPFSPAEVMARVRAILRRIESTPENMDKQKLFVIDNLKISLSEFTVFIDENPVLLTKKNWNCFGRWLRIQTKYLAVTICWTVFGDMNIMEKAEQWTRISRDFVRKSMPMRIPTGRLKRCGLWGINLRY